MANWAVAPSLCPRVPMSEPRELPLHAKHVAAGARMMPFAGYSMPVRYSTIKTEHHAVRNSVGLFDVSHMGEVFVRGPNAIAAVDCLVTNDVSSLVDGKALYTVMCRPDGSIIDDLIVYRLGAEEVLICVNASNRAKDFDWISSHIGNAAAVTDESDEWVQLAVQGPRASEVVCSVVGAEAESIGTYSAQWMEVAGARLLVARTGYTGEDGFELYAPSSAAVPVFEAIMAGGEAHGIVLAGLGARDTLRLEAKYPLYGNDISDETNPIEAGLSWVVKLDVDDFIGRDALRVIKADGPSRRLRGLVLEGRGVLRAGYDVFAGEKKVGATTSGGVAPTLDASIALAYITVPECKEKTLDVEIRGRRIPVRVTRKPFYTRN